MVRTLNFVDPQTEELRNLVLSGKQFSEDPGAETLQLVLTHAEVAWDMMIVGNAIRPDQTAENLLRFGEALDIVLERDAAQAQFSSDWSTKPSLTRLTFYRNLATIGHQSCSNEGSVDLHELRTICRRSGSSVERSS